MVTITPKKLAIIETFEMTFADNAFVMGHDGACSQQS
jgi:hypothetical protein